MWNTRQQKERMCLLSEGAFPQHPDREDRLRVRERMNTLERKYLESLRNGERPTIRVMYTPTDSINADYVVPILNEPKLRRPKVFDNCLRVPSKPKRVPNLSFGFSLSTSPLARTMSPMPSCRLPSLSDRGEPRHLSSRLRKTKLYKKVKRTAAETDRLP
jgi:hypothetical protein